MVLNASQSLSIDLFPGFSLKATDHSTAIADHVQVVANNEWSRNVRASPTSCPLDVSVGDITSPGGIYGKQVF